MDKKIFSAMFFSLILFSLIPIWSVEFVPLQDLPQHLLRIETEKNLFEGDEFYTEYFEFNPLVPYWTADLVLIALTSFFGIKIAAKIFLSLLVIFFPLAFRYFLKGLAVDEKWSLFSFVFSYNYFFQLGFLNFLLGSIFFLILFAYWHKTRLKEKNQEIIFSALLIALFFTHLFPFIVLIFSILFIGFREKQKINIKLAIILFVLLGFVFITSFNSIAGENYFAGFNSTISLLASALAGTPGNLLVAAISLLILVFSLLKEKKESILLLSFACFLCILLFPFKIRGMGYVGIRFFLFFIFFLFAGLKINLSKSLQIIAFVLALLALINATINFTALNNELAERYNDYNLIPEKSFVEVKNLEMPFKESFVDSTLHFWGYAAIEKKIKTNSVWALGYAPIKQKKVFESEEKYIIIEDMDVYRGYFNESINKGAKIIIEKKDYAILKDGN
ncbi:MAG: hypothetical protein ABIA76_00525 [Candidatus Diapherotrites archaeon]